MIEYFKIVWFKIEKNYRLLTAAEETFWVALVASSLGELGGRFEVLAVDILYINGFLYEYVKKGVRFWKNLKILFLFL